MSVCLDAYAVLCWLQDEPGSSDVERLLEAAVTADQASCYISRINLGEVFYRLVRARGFEVAQHFWDDVSEGTLPLTVKEASSRRVREAALLKGRYRIAFADAFAVQLAVELSVPLVTGDPEIRQVEVGESVAVHWLPER